MNETYTLVGYDPSWVVALMPLPALAVASWTRRKRGLYPFAWWQLGIAAYFLVGSVVGLPTEWIFAGACFGGAVVVATSRTMVLEAGKLLTFLVRAVLAAVFAALGFLWLNLGKYYGDQIVLSDSKASFTFLGKPYSAARSGIRSIHVYRHSKRWNLRPWGSWTSFLKTKAGPDGTDMGPTFTGFDVYWGPGGLIRGDAVGARFANWAGVVPEDEPSPR